MLESCSVTPETSLSTQGAGGKGSHPLPALGCGSRELHPKIRGATALQVLWAGVAVPVWVPSLLRAVPGCLQPPRSDPPLFLPARVAWGLQPAQGTSPEAATNCQEPPSSSAQPGKVFC